MHGIAPLYHSLAKSLGSILLDGSNKQFTPLPFACSHIDNRGWQSRDMPGKMIDIGNRPYSHKGITINNYRSNFTFSRSICPFHMPIFEKILMRIRSRKFHCCNCQSPLFLLASLDCHYLCYPCDYVHTTSGVWDCQCVGTTLYMCTHSAIYTYSLGHQLGICTENLWHRLR